MKVEHLTNTVLKIESEISSQLSSCRNFSIASSFIDEDSINIIENCLKQNKKLISGRLLIGIYQHFNRKKDLQRLKKLAQQYSKIFQVQVSKDKRFHWKYYCFENTRNINLYIGSANFTTGGLQKNGEIIVKISDSKSTIDKSFIKLILAFDKELNNSGSIRQFKVELYEESKLASFELEGSDMHPDLKSFFDNTKNQTKKLISDKAVVSYLPDTIKPSTEKAVLNYNPEWNNSNVDFFVCATKRHFELCCELKNLLIITREGRNVYKAFWTTYEDSCDSIKIDKCNYFILHEWTRKNKETTLTETMIKTLKDKFGIDIKARKEPFISKVLGKRQVDKVRTMIK